MLPVVQAPFRVYFAYNPLRVFENIQTPIVADRAAFPNNATFLNSVASFGLRSFRSTNGALCSASPLAGHSIPPASPRQYGSIFTLRSF